MVSIIVLTYNRFRLLTQTIKTILDQTYSDFEIIIVNDGSTDETCNIKSFINDSRIRLFSLDKQNNLAKLRNFGVQQSKGDYIAFCDDDDLWIKTKLETQIPLLDTYKFICSNAKLIDIDDKVLSEKYINIQFSSVLDTKMLLLENVVMPSSVVFEKQILTDDKPFDENVYTNLCEDYNLWIKLSLYVKMYFLNDELILHRVHNSWARSFKHSQQIYSNHISLIQPFTESKDSEIKKAAYLSLINNIIYKIKNLYEQKEYNLAFREFFSFFLILFRPGYFKAFCLKTKEYFYKKN